ncbi:hypothetical protein CSQ85_07780 [Bifidobacterium rousetti]|uniref:hypothetical protein n=1 Tax=Bifidobacterium rousetti TaxID=2045439 RepID=UPI00123BEF12|nr:hypothetical protein [Bifidobacterium rousetti]KAA8818756.1 hypothetical protein CSQ85_07780 [Bifidobacterium rousetti]
MTDGQRARMLDEGPSRGQLWLVDDEHDAEYVFVVDRGRTEDQSESDDDQTARSADDDPRMIHVMVASCNTDDQTVGSMVIDGGGGAEAGGAVGGAAEGVGMFPVVVWPRLTIAVPLRLFDRPLCEYRPEQVRAAIHAEPDPEYGVAAGHDPQEAWMPAYDRLRDRIRLFARWHALCATLPKMDDDEDKYDTNDALSAYADGLRAVLGLSVPEVLAVMRGTLSLTEEQNAAMTQAGFTEIPRKRIVIQKSYLIRAENPRWRPVADAISERNPQVDSRYELARRAFVLAARTSGHGDAAVDGALGQAALELSSEQRSEQHGKRAGQ